LVLPVAIGAGILVLGGAGAFFALHKNAPAAPPVATTPAPAAPVATAPAQPPTVAAKPVSTPAGALDQCRAIWTFDQGSGSTVVDTTGNGYNATVIGDTAVWLKPTDPSGGGLRLTGTNFVEVSGAVINTAHSFTAMVRVNLDAMEAKKYQTFLSIDGREMSGFAIQFNPYAGQATGRFEFARLETDSKTATKIAVKAKPNVTTGTWYHLAAVYDADAQEMSLYLDGKLQESLPFVHAWQATGKTAIGRGEANGHDTSYSSCIVRDVRLYASALTADQIKKLAK
jgi:hypothetical protein